MDTRRTKILYGGLAGFVSIVIIQLVTAPTASFDLPLVVALICFAASLPILVMGVLVSYFKENYKKTFDEPKLISVLLDLGGTIPYFGILAIFWHFNFLFAIIFFVSSLIAAFAFFIWDKKIKDLNAKPESKKKPSSVSKRK